MEKTCLSSIKCCWVTLLKTSCEIMACHGHLAVYDLCLQCISKVLRLVRSNSTKDRVCCIELREARPLSVSYYGNFHFSLLNGDAFKNKKNLTNTILLVKIKVFWKETHTNMQSNFILLVVLGNLLYPYLII